jgi:hypothetical protein
MQMVLLFSPMACRQAPRLPATDQSGRELHEAVRGTWGTQRALRIMCLLSAVMVPVEGGLAEHFELRDESSVQRAVQLADASGAPGRV